MAMTVKAKVLRKLGDRADEFRVFEARGKGAVPWECTTIIARTWYVARDVCQQKFGHDILTLINNDVGNSSHDDFQTVVLLARSLTDIEEIRS